MLFRSGVFRGEAAEGHGSLGQVRHTKGRAKRIIYLFMAGGPSQLDLFDYKPRLKDLHKTELPASVRMGQRITGMTSGQSSLPVVNSMFKFSQHGKSGTWFSEVTPHIAGIADDIAVIKTINTEAINHDPAITYIQTGFQQPGRPCVGSWLSYGLGTENSNLPAFIVMISSGKESDQPLFARLWSAGFLPSEYQGVQFRGGSDPVLFLSNPPGVSATNRRRVLDGISKLNAKLVYGRLTGWGQDGPLAQRAGHWATRIRTRIGTSAQCVTLSRNARFKSTVAGPTRSHSCGQAKLTHH